MANPLPNEWALFNNHGTLACALKKDMVSQNITYVKALDQPVAPIFAESKPKEAKKESANKACGLSSKIILCKEIILNPGPTEFAAGLLLLGATRTKTFVGPYPNFDRFEQICKLPSLGK